MIFETYFMIYSLQLAKLLNIFISSVNTCYNFEQRNLPERTSVGRGEDGGEPEIHGPAPDASSTH